MIDAAPADANDANYASNASSASTAAPARFEFPHLEQIGEPLGALAGALQTFTSCSVAAPRHSGCAFPSYASIKPGTDAAPYFGQLFDGFMAAHAPLILKDCDNIRELIDTDDNELSAERAVALANDDAERSGSQPARAVSMWLLLRGVDLRAAAHPASALRENLRLLDGFSAWIVAQDLAKTARACILAGHDTQTFESATRSQRVGAPTEEPCARLAIRWIDKYGTLRTEVASLTTSNVYSAGDAAMLIRNAAIFVACTYTAPLSTVVYRSLLTSDMHAAEGAYARLYVTLAVQFRSYACTPPSVTQSEHTPRNVGPLESTGVFVRLTPRNVTDSGALAECAFHGMVIAPQHNKHSAIEKCALHAHDKNGLPAPRDADALRMGLHICAVQAERRCLGMLISRFGKVGVSGGRICPPNSWILASAAAIRPIDEQLCNSYRLQPCSWQSLLPGNAALTCGFEAFFLSCERLYQSTCDEEKLPLLLPEMPAGLRVSYPECSRRSRLFGNKAPAVLSAENKYVLSAFHLELQSERTTIGDALYSSLSHGAPSAVIKLLQKAAERLDASTSLRDMLHYCTQAANLVETRSASIHKDNEVLRRLWRIASCVRHHEGDFSMPHPKRACAGDADGGAFLHLADDEITRRVISACRLSRGAHRILKKRDKEDDMQWANVVPVIAQALRLPTDVGIATVEYVEEVLLRAHKKSTDASWAAEMYTALLRALQIVAAESPSPLVIHLMHKISDGPTALAALHTHAAAGDCLKNVTIDAIVRDASCRLLFVHQSARTTKLCAFEAKKSCA